MKYALLLLIAMPLFATDTNEQRMQAEMAEGKMIPVVDKGEVTAYRMDPTTNELENKKITKVVEDKSDEE